MNDITERKLVEKQLLEKEKNLQELNITKDKFLAIIAHDLRNPFHIITNMSELICRNIDKKDFESVSKIAKSLNDTSKTTFNLLQNLLEWAMIQKNSRQLNIKRHQLIKIINNELITLQQVYHNKELKIEMDVDNSIYVDADEHMIKTVIRNLLSNAAKYSFPNGCVQINSHKDNDHIIIGITDSGVGISIDDQKKLFRTDASFSKKGTLDENGTGMGLILCSEFIGLHGGSISVQSKEGNGSTFKIRLPAKRPEILNIVEKP